ncbi:MAG TPA: Rne/Rng family ribonuclease [Firmicutes bacterium]|nr:Rne/Rng family ribonuclease [Bacillota bacterium]
MKKQILVSVDLDETRVALLEDGVLVEFYIERPARQRIVGNIYKGRVENVLPGMQAAFVDIGLEKNAFLYVGDALPSRIAGDEVEIDGEIRPRDITDVVRPGQSIMVQVVKEGVGSKGARVSTHFTLPGRYLVLMPTVDYVGVSRRIEDSAERSRLRQVAEKLDRKGLGLIVRTAAEGKSESELEGDLKFLLKLWTSVQNRTRNLNAPGLLYSDPGLLYRVVRDMLGPDVEEVWVDSVKEYDRLLELAELLSPDLKQRIRLFTGRGISLFESYDVENEIERALRRKVWLKNGGYIVIDRCEALTAIDVNTGRFVGSTSLSDTVYETNMEAAVEIARQIRLRDIGGIIIVDFIDMDKPEQRQAVLDALKQRLRLDRTPTTVTGFTELGLLQITRKKVGLELSAVMEQPCPYCGGTGMVLSDATVASKIRREIVKILSHSASEAILVEVHPSVASLLIGPNGANLRELEKMVGKTIFIRGSENAHVEDLNIKALGAKEEVERRALPVHEGEILTVKIEGQHSANQSDGIARLEGYVVDVEGAGHMVGMSVEVEITRVYRTYAKARLFER